MRIKTITLVLMISIVIMGYFPLTSATSSQWFPTEGTISEYTVSLSYYMKNGTIFTADRFDLYNQSTTYYFIPSINKYLFSEASHPAWTSIQNRTPIRYRYSYTELSSTQWKRMHAFIWGENNTLSKKALNIYMYFDTHGNLINGLGGSDDAIGKNQFIKYGDLPDFGILDYFDRSLGLGGQIFSWPNVYFTVLASTPEFIVAYRGAVGYNFTYVANGDGRVQYYAEVSVSGTVDPHGVKTMALTLNLNAPSSSEIPSFPVIFTVVGLIIFGAYYLLKEASVRRKIANH